MPSTLTTTRTPDRRAAARSRPQRAVCDTIPEASGPAPLVDTAALERLHDELEGNDRLWNSFLQTYTVRLPHRVERISLALAGGDTDAAMDAVLSLRTSSQMAGAARLARMTLTLEQSIRGSAEHQEPDMILRTLASTHLPVLAECARHTAQQLQHQLRDAKS